MYKIILVLGGIRSGKSVFAEKKALYYSASPYYLATGIAFDAEMKERVKIHQERRRQDFSTIEEPADLRPVLKSIQNETVLVDCLTLNLSNRMLNRAEDCELATMIAEDDLYISELIEIAKTNDLKLILVANEVGLAPVSMNSLGRKFQDLQGRWNRHFAAAAQEVWFIQAGIARAIKKEPARNFTLSAPSFVLPTGYLENIVYLQHKVQDIQLLLFESSAEDPLFSNDTLSTLNYLAGENYLSYSVHMPLSPGICDEPLIALQNTILIMEKLATVKNISGFTFHFDIPKDKEWQDLKPDEKESLTQIYITFFSELKNRFPQAVLTLENILTPISALDEVVLSTGINYCIDIGHTLKQGFGLTGIAERLHQTKIVHLHGCRIKNEKLTDHLEVDYQREIFQLLEKFTGVLTVENYHARMLDESLKVINDYF